MSDTLDLAGLDELTPADPATFQRVYPIKDLSVRADESGQRRIVEAYAAVFDKEVLISDWDGEYREVIRAGSFARTISQRGTRVQVFYNHGRDLYGMPSERYAMPLGVPVEVREDARGVVTATRYSSTPLADEVLQLIEDKAIRGMSFGGRWVAWKETEPKRAGQIRLIERTEVDMREFGPTPFPAYEAARVLGVRNATLDRLAQLVRSMPQPEQERFATMLASTRTDAPASTGTASASDPPGDQPGSDPALLDKLTFDLEHRRRQLQR